LKNCFLDKFYNLSKIIVSVYRLQKILSLLIRLSRMDWLMLSLIPNFFKKSKLNEINI
jgi:hypothetical protein